MSSRIHFSRFHAVTPVIFALGAAVAPFGTARAQVTPQRALLNHVPVPYQVEIVDARTTSIPIDGERALLGRSGTEFTAAIDTAVQYAGASVINGERALLGRVVPSGRRGLASVR